VLAPHLGEIDVDDDDDNGLLARAFRHEGFKKGVAAAGAGALFALATEVLFPSNEP
jgi:hypothetical protein